MKTAVSYARYSPGPNQTEASISAQLRAINEYAAKNDIIVIKEYVDESKSASSFATEERPQFEQRSDYIEKFKNNCLGAASFIYYRSCFTTISHCLKP